MEAGGTYPLLLGGYKRLEAGGHAEAQLVHKGRLGLAVDLHPHTRLEGRVLCKWRQTFNVRRPSQLISSSFFFQK